MHEFKRYVNQLSLAKYINDVSFGFLSGSRQFSKESSKKQKYNCFLSLRINLLVIVNNIYIAT